MDKKLTNQNYQIWKYKLELLLIKEELWDIVNNEKPNNADALWTKLDDKGRAIIGLTLENNQHVRKLETAREYWLALKTYHEKSSLTNKIILLKKLCRM